MIPGASAAPTGGAGLLALAPAGDDRSDILELAERSAEIGIWDTDLATSLSRGTPQFFRIMGLPPSDKPVPMEQLRALRHPDDGRRVLEGFRKAIDSGADTYEMEYRIIRPDGQVRWIFGRGRIVRDSRGKPIRYSGVDIDITRRKEAELALVESRERLRLAQEAAGIGSWDLDIRSGTVTWSESQWRLRGIAPRQEPIGIEEWGAAIHADDRDMVLTRLHEAIAGGNVYRAEFRVLLANGGIRWLTARSTTIFGEDGRPVRILGVDVDVTAQREAAIVLEQVNRTLEERVQERSAALEVEGARRAEAEAKLRQSQKMEAVGQLTGGIAHDFNNLLTVVIGNLEMIERRMMAISAEGGPPPDPKIFRSVGMAVTGARTAAQLTHRLLAFSRRQPLDPRPVNGNDLVQGMKELIQRTISEAITVETRLAPDLWPTLADPNQLESALLNLVLNARDAMPQGGRLTIVTANHIQPGDDGERHYILLTVADTGVGIARDALDKVFEPFFTTKPLGAGSGLGLSMVYGFVNQSGGHVTVDSEVGKGTTVSLYLPRHAGHASDPVPGENRDEPKRLQRAHPGETILVVEDNESVRRYAVDSLVELGYAVLEATDARAALSLFDAALIKPIDLVFSDIVLSAEMSGVQLAERIRSQAPDLPILLTTGFMPDGKLPELLSNMMYFLPKPYTFEVLAAKVRSIIDLAKLRRLARAG